MTPNISPNGDAKQRWGTLKWRLLTNISPYLRNGARQGHTYYRTLKKTRMDSIEWFHFE